MAELVDFQGQKVYRIFNNDSQAWIAPQYGARLLKWSVGHTELITWPDTADFNRVNKVRGGNPILFPFIARHMVNGEIGKWKDGSTVREMPVHGFARDMPFQVVESTSNEILMRLEDNEITRGYYPFSFALDVRITVNDDNELRYSLKTSNKSDSPLPYYLGHHFYFKVPHQERSAWKIQIPCSQTARQKLDGSITFNSCNNLETDFADESLIDRFHIMEKPELIIFGKSPAGPRIRIRLDHTETIPWGAVTTWTESPESDFFCVEPWIGLPNAIHHRHGLRWLDPGATEEAICKIDVTL